MSDPEWSESGPAPRSGVPTWVPPVSADIPPPMCVPAAVFVWSDVEESAPDPEPESLEDVEEESDEEPDEESGDESDEERDDDSDPESDDDSEEESDDPSPPPSPSAPSPSDVPDSWNPSMRLSMAWWARWPAFSPRLSRTPSARVCGV
ncbi:hypothetical protein ACWEWI_39840, partial [Streptomyces sp. NPDC003753]